MNRREGVFLGNNDKIRRALFQYFFKVTPFPKKTQNSISATAVV